MSTLRSASFLGVVLLIGVTEGCTDILISSSGFFFHLDASTSSDVRVGDSFVLIASFGRSRCHLLWKSADPRIARVHRDGRLGGRVRGRVVGVSEGTTVIIVAGRCVEKGLRGDSFHRVERRQVVVVRAPPVP